MQADLSVMIVPYCLPMQEGLTALDIAQGHDNWEVYKVLEPYFPQTPIATDPASVPANGEGEEFTEDQPGAASSQVRVMRNSSELIHAVSHSSQIVTCIVWYAWNLNCSDKV